MLTGKVVRKNWIVFAYNSLMSVLRKEENEAAEQASFVFVACIKSSLMRPIKGGNWYGPF